MSILFVINCSSLHSNTTVSTISGDSVEFEDQASGGSKLIDSEQSVDPVLSDEDIDISPAEIAALKNEVLFSKNGFWLLSSMAGMSLKIHWLGRVSSGLFPHLYTFPS